jgi:hypothetical protein
MPFNHKENLQNSKQPRDQAAKERDEWNAAIVWSSESGFFIPVFLW